MSEHMGEGVHKPMETSPAGSTDHKEGDVREPDMELVGEIEATIGRALFAKLTAYFASGRVSLADLGQFPASELDNLHALACQLVTTEQYEQARAVVELLLSLSPAQAECWTTLGVIRQRVGQHALALKAYERAVEIRANMAAVVYAAECCLVLDRPRDAQAWLDRCKRLPVADAAARQLVERSRALAHVLKTHAQDAACANRSQARVGG